jgi:hypothetical protein
MWLLVLILSIKLQMSTWYWIIFTIITIFRPIIWVFKYNFADGYMSTIGRNANRNCIKRYTGAFN